MSSKLEVRLSKSDRTYKSGETVSGVVSWSSSSAVTVSSLQLRAMGIVKPTLDPRTVGIFEALYSSIKPIEIMSTTIDMVPSGKQLPREVQLPFDFPVEALAGRTLTETYHGVYVTVKYTVEVHMTTVGSGLLGFSKQYTSDIEFIVEVPNLNKLSPVPVEFEIKPESLENVKKSSVHSLPKFLVSGRLDKTNCSLAAPFTGEVTVVHSEAKIRSLELQLVRVETIAYAEGQAREATEIQNLQIGDGDVPRGLTIPLHMIFPRTFTCPTSIGDSFRVEFEVNIIVVFEDGFMVTENFPISLFRRK